jgi:uncharacterized protein (TIGR00730 family)
MRNSRPEMENQPNMTTNERAGRCVLVFCASSRSCDPAFHDAAAALGEMIARAGNTLVYGGGAVGSMGALADAALAEGGRVLGVIPRFMRELEWAHSGLTELRLVDDMQQRKREMLRMADAIVTLPGGSGTFEELFEAITSKRLGLFSKPIVIVNQNQFYDPLFSLLHSSVEERFMNDEHLEMWQAVDTIDEVLPAIESAAAWPEDAVRFATR